MASLGPARVTGTAGAQVFSVSEALSAPFSNGLVAAPAKARVAWVTDAEGRRNVWVAGADEPARQVTQHTGDDGQDIDGLAWSADGDRLAWTRGTGAQGPEHPVANPAELPGPVRQVVAFADLRSHTSRVVAEGHSPLFSASGKSMYFLRGGNIWVADLDQLASTTVPAREARKITPQNDDVSGDPLRSPAQAGVRQLLFVRGAAGGLRLSPDGTRLMFVSSRGDHSFVGVYSLTAGTLRWIDPGVGLDHDAVWSPDGLQVAFVREVPIVSPIADRWMREGAPWSVRVADPATGKGVEIWQADQGPGSVFHGVAAREQLLWTRSNDLVFPWEKGGWTRLYRLPLRLRAQPAASSGAAPCPTGPPVLLTPGNFEVDVVASSGTVIVYSANGGTVDPSDIDRRHIWSVDLEHGGRVSQLTAGQGIETGPAVLSDGEVAAMQGDAQRPLVPVLLVPAPIASAQPGPAQPAPAQRGPSIRFHPFAPALVPPGFPGSQFVIPRQVVFPASDGMPIHGQLFLPRNAALGNAAPGAKLPAVVFFHGGPRRQMLLGYNSMQYYAQAYEFNQYLANHGFIVLSVNYRSGTGYGLQFRQALNYGANGASEYADVAGAAAYLAAQLNVDPRRIGAWGGSYGGYLTALALARSSDLFAAGVDLHGVHDWSLELDLWKPTDEPGVDRAAIARRAFASSPMADVDRWKSPVLLIQGDDDRNVLFAQTVRLAAALRQRHTPVEVLSFPDEVHDFLLGRSWIEAYERSAAFLQQHLQAK